MRLRAFLLFLSGSIAASAQYYRVNTIAGFGTFGGDGAAATAALLDPGPLAVDGSGKVYVSDTSNYRIRAIDRTGTIATLTGRGFSAYFGEGTQASSAGMSTASDIAADANGDVYFSDVGNNRIREVTAGGIIKTIAGTGSCGTVTAGMPAAAAPVCDLDAVAVDPLGRLYFPPAARSGMSRLMGR